MNEFSYAQALLFYKENIEELKKNNIIQKIFIEQDGATPHTSFNNKKLLKNLFGENLIQNPPNSPDLAYPIETLWALLKKMLKRECKKFRRITKIYHRGMEQNSRGLPKETCEKLFEKNKKSYRNKG